MTNIEFVNHSSYVLRRGEVRLICDPWLEGSVFDNGWDLLAETRFNYERFGELTHIWFSHEHPDHFNPHNVSKIPPQIRAGLTVLFQRTLDKKVVDYCRRLGFREVVEMSPGAWLHLGEDLEALCEPHDNGDSWLAIRCPDFCILNLNDCVVTTAKECVKILKKIGTVDILATQFSYANRVGNADQRWAREAAAEQKLSWMKTQVLAFKPMYVIPFASFSYFSHEDNWYMNDSVNEVGFVSEVIREETRAKPVVLYPGDCWDFDGTARVYDCESAVTRYAADYERVRQEGFRHRSRQVDMDELLEHGNGFLKKLQSKNTLLARLLPFARLLPSATIFVEDHAQAITFSLAGVRLAERDRTDCDLLCKSDALDYCFLWEWGGRTLDITGRFQVPDVGRYWKFKAYSTLASFNNRGEGLKQTVKTFRQRLVKTLRRTSGILSSTHLR